MQPLILALCVGFASSNLFAQRPGWQPSLGHTQVPIWLGTAPDAQFGPAPNTEQVPEPGEVENVSRPTLTVYPPTGNNTGAAVVVFPGGGYYVLAIDIEGTEVCDWLTAKGITCVLLKYRVPNSGPQWDERCKCQIKPKAPMALEDAQRTVGLVRFRAPEYRIDPHKIGVLGFSAGGHLVTDICTHFADSGERERHSGPKANSSRSVATLALRLCKKCSASSRKTCPERMRRKSASSEERGAGKGRHVLSPPQHTVSRSAMSAPFAVRTRLTRPDVAGKLQRLSPNGRRAPGDLPGVFPVLCAS